MFAKSMYDRNSQLERKGPYMTEASGSRSLQAAGLQETLVSYEGWASDPGFKSFTCRWQEG